MKRLSAMIIALLIMIPLSVMSAELKFGILPRLPEKELTEMFTPLAEYLGKETGMTVSLVIPKDFDAYAKQAVAGDFDIGFTNPNIYIMVKKAVPRIKPLALASEPESGTKLRGIFFVVKESPIQSIRELKGKRVCFVDAGSAAGYIAQMLELKKAGVKKEDMTVTFAGKPPKVGEAVRDGKADAGGMPGTVFKKLPFEYMLRVIGTTIDLPNWPIHTTKKTDQSVAAKVREALLKLKPRTAEADRVLQKAALEGFVPTADKDFDLMRNAAKAAGVF